MGVSSSKSNNNPQPTLSTSPDQTVDAVAAEASDSTPPLPLEVPGKKTVEDLKIFNPEDYEDDTNQTGLSHHEIKIQQRFYSAPQRPRGRAYTAAKEAEQAKKAARADKKEERAARRRKSKTKNDPSPELLEPNTVPWALENTKKLGILNLSKMQLDHVPDQVFDAVPGTARIINVSFNSLTNLDQRICDYVLVQRLIANGNLLTSIPDNLVRMTALKKLDLATNRLTSLPDAFEGMRFLEHVDLGDNQLSQLPPSFATLQLTALNLCNNRFTQAPTQVCAMEWLMDLDLSSNQLTDVPHSYALLTQLIGLNLEGNKIVDFPNAILRDCTELVTLRLKNNPITMPVLEAKEAYAEFASRRRIKFRRQLDAGTITEADLDPADK